MKKIILLLVLLQNPSLLLAEKAHCDFTKISENIFVIVGSNHKTCPIKEVEHPLTNPSVIIGNNGVIVIDPGSSKQVGNLLLNKIKAITDKPVVAVFNTHIHGLYWLGNQAIREKFPKAKIYAHTRMIERIKNGEGEYWVEAITGKHKGGKTNYVIPDVALNGNEALDIEGVKLSIHYTGHAHTDHDIIIELPELNAVFLGGLVVEPEVPSQGVPGDANFKGQISATDYVIGLNADIYIPGRGMPGNIELPTRAKKFLETLREFNL